MKLFTKYNVEKKNNTHHKQHAGLSLLQKDLNCFQASVTNYAPYSCLRRQNKLIRKGIFTLWQH